MHANRLLTFVATAIAAFATIGAEAKPIAFKPGHVWEYKTRPQDAGSLVKIQKISRDRVLGTIYHVSLVGLKTRNAQFDGVLMHAPVTYGVLERSATRRFVGAATFPSADEGIAEWRKAEGGVFTISLAQIAELIDGQTAGVAP